MGHKAMPMDSDETLLRLPAVLTRYPVGKSTWWKGVAEGRFPKPVKLGPRVTAWRKSEIDQLIADA